VLLGARAFGSTIRELRTARGLSQEAVAERGGFDRTYLSLLERGLRTPTITAIFRLADALGVSADSLVSDAYARIRVLDLTLPSP
jgi:transcriptional regulator with XRE-family HTH domain